jgi:hypothetical protein
LDREGNALHTRMIVYAEMLTAIAQKYTALPPIRELYFEEIEFFYEGIRAQLESDTKPAKGRR